jgi:hypothetical protein
MPDAEPDAEPDGAEITCTPPMANCDGNPANGCETNTAADPRNCTACGMVCPGLNTASANVTCNSGCTFSCQGEHYDVDNDPANGCEVVDNPMNNHTIATSLSEGSRTCTDTDTFTFTGMIPSDSRIHMSPSVSGFDQVSGSAPDFFTIAATGGFTCIDDLSVTLTVTGSASPACYNLTVSTNLITAACQTSTGGTCTITHGSGAYTDGANIGFEVRKTCSVGTVRENASYTVTGHL